MYIYQQRGIVISRLLLACLNLFTAQLCRKYGKGTLCVLNENILMSVCRSPNYRATIFAHAIDLSIVVSNVLFCLCPSRRTAEEGGARVLRSTPDWGDAAVSGEHLWSPTSVSGDCCYVGDAECQVSSTPRKSFTCDTLQLSTSEGYSHGSTFIFCRDEHTQCNPTFE